MKYPILLALLMTLQPVPSLSSPTFRCLDLLIDSAWETISFEEELMVPEILKPALVTLKANPFQIEAHKAAAEAAVEFLQKERGLMTHIVPGEMGNYIIILDVGSSKNSSPRYAENRWLPNLVARLASDSVKPAEVGFSTSNFKMFSAETTEVGAARTRIFLPWDSLTSKTIPPKGVHELNHWHRQKLLMITGDNSNRYLSMLNEKKYLPTLNVSKITPKPKTKNRIFEQYLNGVFYIEEVQNSRLESTTNFLRAREIRKNLKWPLQLGDHSSRAAIKGYIEAVTWYDFATEAAELFREFLNSLTRADAKAFRFSGNGQMTQVTLLLTTEICFEFHVLGSHIKGLDGQFSVEKLKALGALAKSVLEEEIKALLVLGQDLKQEMNSFMPKLGNSPQESGDPFEYIKSLLYSPSP